MALLLALTTVGPSAWANQLVDVTYDATPAVVGTSVPADSLLLTFTPFDEEGFRREAGDRVEIGFPDGTDLDVDLATGDLTIRQDGDGATAGTVTIAASGDGFDDATCTFDVVAATTDAAASTLVASAAEATADRADSVTVTLENGHGNAVQGATVELSESSGPGTDIQPASAATDEQGVAEFTVTSAVNGTATYQAEDSDASVTVDATIEVDWVTPPSPAPSQSEPTATDGRARCG